MKRIICLIMAATTLLCFCACGDQQPQGGMVGHGGQDETSPYDILQSNVIGTLGITVENSRIVAMKSSPEGYVRYVVVRYNENGEKTGELSYFFCLSDQTFDKLVEENKDNTAAKVYESERYITIPSNLASKGVYTQDLEILRKDYFIKGQVTPEDYKK